MVVHLPDGMQVARWGDERRWQAYGDAFGNESLAFWRWQESTADALWELALRQPAWPPQDISDALQLANHGIDWLKAAGAAVGALPGLAADALAPSPPTYAACRRICACFADAQLLISAQAASDQANALYGAAALDLPQRGVMHLEGGMGTVASLLAEAVRNNHGQVLYRQEATRIRLERDRPVAVETRRGEALDADLVVANLTPWNVTRLLDGQAPRLRRLANKPAGQLGRFCRLPGRGWSADPGQFPAAPPGYPAPSPG